MAEFVPRWIIEKKRDCGGVSGLKKAGEAVEAGEPLLRLHARTRAEAETLVPQALAACPVA